MNTIQITSCNDSLGIKRNRLSTGVDFHPYNVPEVYLKVLRDLLISSDNALLKKFLEEYLPKHKTSRITVWKDGRVIVLNPEEIIYCAISGREVKIVTDRSHYISCESLNQWEEKLMDYNFFRCHRSFIVNIDRICQINPLFNNTYNLKLKGTAEEIPVSRRYSKQLRQIFNF